MWRRSVRWIFGVAWSSFISFVDEQRIVTIDMKLRALVGWFAIDRRGTSAGWISPHGRPAQLNGLWFQGTTDGPLTSTNKGFSFPEQAMAPFDNELYGYWTDLPFLPEGGDVYGGISDGGLLRG